jgi:hypothetical protein
LRQPQPQNQTPLDPDHPTVRTRFGDRLKTMLAVTSGQRNLTGMTGPGAGFRA